MTAGGLVHLWNKWGIQIMVLASFGLQVFLLVFGGIRRRKSSAVLRLSLWLAYLLADSTAIYTLGHLSVASGSREHQLVPFWAPFLLLHLGGPDNITAYALEDNRLWLRHLQTLTVQVLGAAYVLYRYITDSGTLLLVASISMLVAGIVKYGERVWALKCGNMASIGKSREMVDPCELLRQGMGEEEILLRAHSQFDICKCALTDMKLQVSSADDAHRHPVSVGPDDESAVRPQAYKDEDAYKLVELELSLMYDILYTKAAVIHTWYGFCIHLISLLGTATTFLLFQLSIIGSRANGLSRVDVIISYVLLVGALALEATSVCRALVSTWTCSFLYRRGRRWEWLLHVVTYLRRRVRPASRRLWSGSVGQYNLFHRCTRDRNEIGGRLATKIGLQNWWNKLHFRGSFSGNDTFSTEDLKEHVLRALPGELEDMATDLNPRGAFIQDFLGAGYDGPHWSADIDLDESILVLHIATDVYIRESPTAHEEKLVEATKVLSNYMMFLLVVKPEMLPGRARQNVYLDTCKYLDGHWSLCLDDESAAASPRSWNPCCLLKELIHHQGPSGSRVRPREKLANKIFSKYKDALQRSEAPDPYRRSSNESIGKYGFLLAKEIFEAESRGEFENPNTLEVILKLWVEMMLYAADRCSRESHARQLSNGGELITIVWLLTQHQIYLSRYLHPPVDTRSTTNVKTEDSPRTSDAASEDSLRAGTAMPVEDSPCSSDEDGPRNSNYV